jgi:hypothetical protein
MKKKKSTTKQSFWRTLPGLITAITALVSALTGLIVAISDIDMGLNSSSGKHNYIINTKSFETFPFYLKNMVSRQDDFLYWVHFDMENKSKDPLLIDIQFEVLKGPATVNPKPLSYTVYRKMPLSQEINPPFEFLKDDIDGELKVKWIIKDTEGNILHQDTKVISVLPKNMIDWDLTKPDGEPLPHDFLIASLSSWTITMEQSVKDRAELLLKNISVDNFSLFASSWFKTCYENLFHHSQGINIIPALNTFPMKGRQRIKTPLQVLEQKQATPLEAALLVAALSRHTPVRSGTKVILFVRSEAEKPKDVIIAWYTSPDNLKAFTLNRASESGFDENEQVTTGHINNLLAGQQGIVEELENRGVYIDENRSTVALYFDRAENYYYIKGLP